MSHAPRHTGATQGSNYAANATNNLNPTKGSCGAHGAKIGRTGNATFANLLSGRLSLPRQLIVQARNALDNTPVQIYLSFTGTIGQGTFGQIEKATLTTPPPSKMNEIDNLDKSKSHEPRSGVFPSSDTKVLSVAVKRVLQDPRYKNRELSIMQKLGRHPNIVTFYYYYFSTSSSSNNRNRRGQAAYEGVCTDIPTNTDMDVYLHLVLECFPGSLCEMVYIYFQRSISIPPLNVKMFTFQMLKALAYLHSHHICHRDIKSSNLLVNESTLVLKLCDFGSAKEMIPGSANVSYISSRYYRAPELLFGAQMYTCAIDTWGAGCVLAEMLRHQCLFTGADSVDQLVKVIRVLGTPSAEDIASMNPMYETYNFPDVQSCPVKLFFPRHTPTDLLSLMSKMLVYNPNNRLTPKKGLLDPCFDELRELRISGKLPNGNPLPAHLFDMDPDPPTCIETCQLSAAGCIGDVKPVKGKSSKNSAAGRLVNDASEKNKSATKSGEECCSEFSSSKNCLSHSPGDAMEETNADCAAFQKGNSRITMDTKSQSSVDPNAVPSNNPN